MARPGYGLIGSGPMGRCRAQAMRAAPWLDFTDGRRGQRVVEAVVVSAREKRRVKPAEM